MRWGEGVDRAAAASDWEKEESGTVCTEASKAKGDFHRLAFCMPEPVKARG
jgi:hypothetical protein